MFADWRKPGTTYHGISYENVERPEIVPKVPEGGLDIHTVPVYWNLPCGRSVCYSIYALRSVPDDELAPDDSDEMYTDIAREFRFSILGCVGGEEPEKDFAEFREDVGTLQDERWKCLKWKRPEKESEPCWWLTNPHDEETDFLLWI